MIADRWSSGPVLRATRLTAGGGEAQVELKPFPATNGGFREIERYRIDQPSGGGFSLRVDDEPLGAAPDSSRAWLWEPGFFAGEVTAELRRSDGRVEGLYLLDVSPDPAKAGRDIFDSMMREVWAEEPSLVIGTEPATIAIGELGTEQDSFLELARLRRHGPLFVEAIERIRRQPRRSLVARRESLPLHRVRRVDRHSAHLALRSPGAAAFLSGNFSYVQAVREPHLNVPAVEESLDSAANRCLLALLGSVLRRTRAVCDRLQVQVDREQASDTRTPLAPRWPARREFLEELGRRLKIRVNQPPFTNVRCAEISAAGLNGIAADPLYARAWALGWRALRTGVSGPPASERLWISPTWEIYERWTFVRLARLLRERFPELEWSPSTDHKTGAHAAWVGQGESKKIELLLQPDIPGGRRVTKHDLWSVSQRRVPDLVLNVDDQSDRRFFVLDAKYRRSRGAVLDAMSSAHIYQDSLRQGDKRSEITLLLVPSGGGAPWLEDEQFQDANRVGVHVLSPDGDTEFPVLIGKAL